MSHCRYCGTEVSPEKAWCPNCNQALEAEEKRAVAREIDTFAGTFTGIPMPPAPTARSVPIPNIPDPAPIPPKLDRVKAPAVSSNSFAPSVSTKEVLSVPSRSWIYVLIGALVGVIVLAILAGVGVGLWYYWK